MATSTGVTLLFVEDDPDDARFVERLLTDHRAGGRGGHDERPIEVETVEHAESLAAGLDLLEDADPDAVLLDLGLPDSDGVETVERMVERAPTVPVVVLTGRTDAGIDAIRSGAQDYLLKGHITAPLLLRSLRYAVERGRVTAELRDRNLRLAVANEILRTDLRNDVSVIVGLGDQLEGLVDPADAEVVESLLDASHHVLELADTVADLMDVISGESFGRREPVPLGTALEPQLDRFRRRDDVDLTVEWRVPSDSPPTVAGTPMLGSVFEHLLSNAAAHTDRETARVEVTVEATDEAVSVSIADDGVGIPDARKRVVVDADAGAADRRTMGAGLYFVTTVLDGIGADIEIGDNVPRGTVVTVRFDRVRRADEPDTEPG